MPANQIHISRVEVAQGARSTFRGRSFNLGASYGRLAYDVCLDGKSTGIFSGDIDLRRRADGTDAAQSHDNLLLSNRAEINTQPRLGILADEVASNHGATVGQPDETALYSLCSRGIAADEARRLLINGFGNQAVADASGDTVGAWIIHRLGQQR